MPDLFGPPDGVGAVKLNDELRRIECLPRVRWTDDGLADFAHELTDALKTPGGSWVLRPKQAQALGDIGVTGGLFGMLRVGAGKTLVSYLADVVSFALRPLLLVPAALVEKTRRDFKKLSKHFKGSGRIKILSYEWLGRVQAAGILEDYNPDLIIADEAHKLKNLKAAVTRRVRRYMNEHPETRFVAMSGTMTKRSIKDYAHIILWCLGPENTPLPRWFGDLELWADALDERKGQLRRANPGALRVLCNIDEDRLWDMQPRKAARLAFRRRLIETPGVVATETTPIDATIIVKGVEPPESSTIDEAFSGLRSLWVTPDGWPLSDGLSVNRHARELALGFFYRWDPRPPDHWLEARKAWCAFVRRTLRYSRKLDSELQVRNEFGETKWCKDWLAVRDDFEPNTVPVWLDESVAEWCADWAHREGGIVWVEHTCFGQAVAQFSGLPFYSRQGKDIATGSYIEDHKPGTPMIASIASNSTGRNLQAWHKNLITSLPPNGQQNEQLFGRTHRDGQEEDEVLFDILINCAEHVGAWWQAVRDAEFVLDSHGTPQKVLLADAIMPSAGDIAFRSGARFDKQL